MASPGLRNQIESPRFTGAQVLLLSRTGLGWHEECIVPVLNTRHGLNAEGLMPTAPELDTAFDPQRHDTSSPLGLAPASTQRAYEWGTRPASTRRDKPRVEDVDDMWDESFASW